MEKELRKAIRNRKRKDRQVRKNKASEKENILREMFKEYIPKSEEEDL